MHLQVVSLRDNYIDRIPACAGMPASFECMYKTGHPGAGRDPVI